MLPIGASLRLTPVQCSIAFQAVSNVHGTEALREFASDALPQRRQAKSSENPRPVDARYSLEGYATLSFFGLQRHSAWTSRSNFSALKHSDPRSFNVA